MYMGKKSLTKKPNICNGENKASSINSPGKIRKPHAK